MRRKLLTPLRRSPLGRWLRARLHARADCFVVSYPKCGRTWLGAMMGKAIAVHVGARIRFPLEPVDVAAAGKGVPLIVFTHAGGGSPPSGRAYVSGKYHDKKVILLVRDPRDVMVSYYFQRVYRNHENYSLNEFIRHPWWGIDRYLEFIHAWLNSRDLLGGFHLVRYEDLHAEPAAVLRRSLAFAGLTGLGDDAVAQAVAFAQFDNLRALALTHLRHDQRIAPMRADVPQSFKLRRGAAGGYPQELGTDDLAFIEQRMRDALPAVLGYASAAP